MVWSCCGCEYKGSRLGCGSSECCDSSCSSMLLMYVSVVVCSGETSVVAWYWCMCVVVYYWCMGV